MAFPYPPSSSPMSSDDYQARDDHQTLASASAIQANPKRLGAVRRVHQRTVKALQGLSKTIAAPKPFGRRK